MAARDRDRPRTIGERMSIPEGSVKSAARVLQILELFDTIRGRASVVDICRELQFPQSSTSALLRTLVDMGYLRYHASDRTYTLTSRVNLMGSWINQSLFDRQQLIDTMVELSRKTGDAIILGQRNDLQVQYIHIIQSTSPARLHVTQGAARPLMQSGLGYALLSPLPNAEVIRLLNRHNTTVPAGRRVSQAVLLAALDETRARGGCTVSLNTVVRGGGVIALALPTEPDQPPMALGIGGISEVLEQRQAQLVKLLATAVRDLTSRRPEGG